MLFWQFVQWSKTISSKYLLARAGYSCIWKKLVHVLQEERERSKSTLTIFYFVSFVGIRVSDCQTWEIWFVNLELSNIFQSCHWSNDDFVGNWTNSRLFWCWTTFENLFGLHARIGILTWLRCLVTTSVSFVSAPFHGDTNWGLTINIINSLCAVFELLYRVLFGQLETKNLLFEVVFKITESRSSLPWQFREFIKFSHDFIPWEDLLFYLCLDITHQDKN